MQKRHPRQSFTRRLSNNLKLNPDIGRKIAMVTLSALLFSMEPDFVIDGVTAATATTPPPPAHPSPALHLTGTPAIINNVIRGTDGQPITITINATEVRGSSTIMVGMLQNNVLYTDPSGLNLPPDANFTVDSQNPNLATFTWTPPVGTSSTTPKLSLKFGAVDTQWNTSRTQTVTINVEDNLPPSFDSASMPTSQPVKVDTPLNIPITANPDPDKDNVTIAAIDLPKGAKFSPAVKNAKGQWVSHLIWTPSLDQIGPHTVTFVASDDKQNPTQTSYPMDFVVGYVDAPRFDASMTNAQSAIANKPLSFPIVVNADAYSKNVTIAADTLLPPGAKLGAARKIRGNWVAMLTWKPSPTMIGNSYPVTFSVSDPAAGTISPITFDVTFNVTAK